MADPNKFYEEITPEHMKDFQFISQGAFGSIFRARHQDWGIDVAVKILTSNTSFTREELLNEARAMDEARFTYVLRLFGLFVGTDLTETAVPRLGLVMEFMENGSLHSLIYRVRFVPWALRFRILHEVALGMNFLHNLIPPLLHLDLKPSNILLDGELHVRVADFGLSKFKRSTTRHASQTSGERDGYGGTLEFMPPEAFSDLNYKPTPSTDVYSYGILMWSVLTGQEPYPYIHPGNMSSLFRRFIPQGQRPQMEDLEKTDNVLKLSDMVRLMKQCWHNDKAQRPPFRECSQETESVYSCYKPRMMAAVRQVQDILVWMNRSSSKGTRLSLGPTSSLGLEERFSTMHLEEPPSRQNEALPKEEFFRANQEQKPSTTLKRSQSARSRKGTERPGHGQPHQATGSMLTQSRPTAAKPRPLSDLYPFPTFPTYPPGFQHYSQSFYGPHQGADEVTRWDHSLLPCLNPGASHRGIHISGHDLIGFQIGNGNVMNVEYDPERKPTRKQ